MEVLFIILIIIAGFVSLLTWIGHSRNITKNIDEGRARAYRSDSNLICPHCQEKGHVRTERIYVKKGNSDDKATGSISIFGIFGLVTGRIIQMTKAHCSNCKSTWQY